MNSFDNDTDRTEELLARALSEEAALVDPRPGALQQIQRRTSSTSRSRTPRLMGALGAAVATAAVITAVVVVGDSNDMASNGTPAATQPTTVAETTTPTTPPAPPPAPTAERTLPPRTALPPPGIQVPVYYVGRGPSNPALTPRLYAESHPVDQPGVDLAVAAVHEFLTSQPIDPDYRSGWPDGVDITGVVHESITKTTYELEGTADIASPGGLTPGEAESAIQAFILTGHVDSTAAFTYNGQPVTRLLGVDVSAPVPLKPEEELLPFVTIDNIVDGQTVTNPVTVKASGNTFEANLNWQLLDADGRKLDEGFTMVGSYGEWSQADIDLGTLEPGTYTFEALEYSAEDGSVANSDDKTFTVE